MFNSRKDLDAAPAEQREKFLGLLAASINKWSWDGVEWVLRQNTTEIERFGFTVTDFPNAPVPDKPTYDPDALALEREAEEIRTQRDALLKESDWAVLPDAPVGDAQVWRDYRQALRDVPQQVGFPQEVVWPSKP